MFNPIEMIGNVNTAMFTPASYSVKGRELMLKVANFGKKYWPQIAIGVVGTAVLAGIVMRVQHHRNNKKLGA